MLPKQGEAMSRKSHDGSYVFILTRLNSVFIFFSRVLNFLVYFIQLCLSCLFPPYRCQHRITTIAYTAFVPGSICTGLQIILFYLASGVFLSLTLHTVQCGAHHLVLRIRFVLGCFVPWALIYTVHKLFVLVLFCVWLGLDIEFHVMIEWYAYHTILGQTTS